MNPPTNPNIHELENTLAQIQAHYGPHAPETQHAKSNLALNYRNIGRVEDARALWRDTGVCRHLKPVVEYLRAQGAEVCFAGQTWSRNCRIWVVFEDVVLDGESLIRRFALPPCVVVHSHRGTHDGSEQGIVCQEHHDALIGRYPEKGLRVIG